MFVCVEGRVVESRIDRGVVGGVSRMQQKAAKLLAGLAG